MSLKSVKSDSGLRVVVFAVLLLFSYGVWIVLEPYKLRALATLIPVLFALQVFINDTLEAILSSKFYRTWWFKFIIAPGTILHELCHLLAALASGCKVSSVSLFRINPSSGTMGYVQYANPDDKWHVFREFLIGLSPFFGCGVAMLAISAVLGGSLMGNIGDLAVKSPEDVVSVFTTVFLSLVSYLQEVTVGGYQFILLVYLQVCFAIGSAPSGQDFKNTLSSIVKHPVSAFFLMLLAAIVILLSESQIEFLGIGQMLSSGINFLFKFAVYVLLLSASVLLMTTPAVVAVAWFMGLTDRLKYVILLIAIISFSATNGLMEFWNRIAVSLLVFALLMLLLRHPEFLLKKN